MLQNSAGNGRGGNTVGGTAKRVQSDIDSATYNLTSEQLVELLHPALQKLGLGIVLAEGHIGKLGLLFLHLKKPSLNGVLDDEFYRSDRTCLPESMLSDKHEHKFLSKIAREIRTIRSTA